MTTELIETMWHNKTPLYIAKKWIVAIDALTDREETRIIIHLGNGLEEWIVNEPLATIISKYNGEENWS